MRVRHNLRLGAAALLLGGGVFLQAQPQGPQQQAPPPQAGLTQAAPAQPAAQAASYRISGIVVDAQSGQPLEGAEVRATRAGTTGVFTRPSLPLGVVTGADGRFAFEEVQAGKYILNARRRGYPAMNYQQHENFFSAVVAGPGMETEDLVFQLRPGAAISGQVTDEWGEAIRGAQVMLYHESLAAGEKAVQSAGQKATDDRGGYRFSGLQPGTYYVAVSAQPWYAQNAPMQTSRPMYIRDAQGNVRMSIEPQAPAPQANPLDVVYPVTFYAGATDAARASPLTLLPGEQAAADFSLIAVPSIHLKLNVPGASTLGQNMNVVATQATMGNHRVNVPAQMMMQTGDTVEVGGVPPGHITLSVMQFQDGRMRTRWSQDVDVSRDTEITLGAQGASASVSGTVKTPGNAALPRQCMVLLRGRETAQGYGVQINADGGFEMQGRLTLAPGTYDVFLSNCPAYHVESVTSTPNVKTSGRSFEVRAGDAVRLTVEIGAGLGRVDGVVLRDDKPAGGVMVLMVPTDGPVAATLILRDQSNSDGSFSWGAVRPGKYTVVAIDNGWNLEWAKPEVLKPLLPGGVTLQVEANGQHKVTVKVQ